MVPAPVPTAVSLAARAGAARAAPADATDRIVRLLETFDDANTPQPVAGLLAGLGIARSTGYPLVRALVDTCWLEDLGRGQVRLGASARQFAFWSGKARQDPRTVAPSGRRFFPAVPRSADAPEGQPEPELLQRVDCARFRRPGPWRLGFANASLSNPWRHALLASVQHQARVYGRRIDRLSVRCADDDPAQQVRDIDALVAEGIDLLLVSVVRLDHPALERKIAALARAGLPVVAVDRSVQQAGSVVSFVTASDRIIGAISARWLAERIDGRGRVWMLSGAEGTGPAADRRAAALEVFGALPGVSIELSAHTQWQPELAFESVRDLLRSDGRPPAAVWCDSGLQGVGSLDAFVDAGYGAGRIPPHTGGDLNRMYRRALELRVPHLGVDYPAAMGAKALSTCVAVLSGHTVPRRLHTDLQCIVTRGCETGSVKADMFTDLHVRMDRPGDYVLSQGQPQRIEGFTPERDDPTPVTTVPAASRPAEARPANAGRAPHSANLAVERWHGVMQRVLAGPYHSVSALVRDCGMARATGYRLVGHLQVAGFIDRDENGELIAGEAVLRTSLRALGQGELDLRLLPCLQALRRSLDATVFAGFWRRDGTRIDLGPVMPAGERRQILHCDGSLAVVAVRPLSPPAHDGTVVARMRMRERPHLPPAGGAAARAPSAPLTQVVDVVVSPIDALPLSADPSGAGWRPVLGVWPQDLHDGLDDVARALARQGERLRRALKLPTGGTG